MGLFDLFKDKKKELGFSLENVQVEHQKNPRHFLIPSQEEINQLKLGDQVRLIFVLDTVLENGCRAERMWVELTEICDEKFKGRLTNQPAFITSIQLGDELDFAQEHIASLMVLPLNLDTQKGAMITKDCFLRREINWAIHDEPHHPQDSGWQFFTGYESQEDLDDPSKITIISLEDALEMEPLLETVLDKNGEAYVYQAEQNAFVEDC